MECGWYAYQTPSGETLFFFNQLTGQYRWLSCSCSKSPYLTHNFDNNTCKAVGSQVIEQEDKHECFRASIPVRSIATETDLPSTVKTLKTQGTQTEYLDGIPCTDDVLSNILLRNNKNHQNILDLSKLSQSRDTLMTKNLEISDSTVKENGKLQFCPKEHKQTSNKVKLFDCSKCEKAFTSYAFLIKHEKYHGDSNNQEKIECRTSPDLKTSVEDQEKRKNDCHSTADIAVEVRDLNNALDLPSLLDTPSSSVKDDNPRPESCFQCGKRFLLPDEYDAHLQSHVKEKFCNLCKKSYKNSKAFLRHCAIHVDVKHKCQLCKRVFVLKSSLTKHIHYFHKTAHAEKADGGNYTYKCGSCNTLFELSDTLAHHQKATKHQGIEYQCGICKKHYIVFSDLLQHQQEEHNPDDQNTQPLPPNSSKETNSNCQEKLLKQDDLFEKDDNLKSSPLDAAPDKNGGRFWCHECKVSYGWRCDLVKHKIKKKCCLYKPVVRINGNSEQYFCCYCDKLFCEKQIFIKHHTRHFLRANPPHKCDRCGKMFLTLESLGKHFANTHLPVKRQPHYCERCAKSYSNWSNLQRHIKQTHTKKEALHVKIKEFSCDECIKVFDNAISLSNHKRIHVTENNGLQNGKAQPPSESSLKKASKLESKPEVKSTGLNLKQENDTQGKYRCSKCKKVFSNLKCLKRHEKLLNHTLKNPAPPLKNLHIKTSAKSGLIDRQNGHLLRYYCKVCKKSFQHYNVFYKHRSTHKREETKACRVCRKLFKANKLSGNVCISCKKGTQKAKNDLFPCGVCGKEFLRRKSLGIHYRVHGKKYFECQNCGVVFANVQRLSKHMGDGKKCDSKISVSYKEKLHECNRCGKFYAGRKSLRRHQLKCPT